MGGGGGRGRGRECGGGVDNDVACGAQQFGFVT